MAIPFEGTLIGADGKRYADDDPDRPVDAPTFAGKYATTEAMHALVDPIADQLDALDAEASPTRTVTDGVTTNASKNVDSDAANFTAADIGASITCAKFPEGTVIESITDENTAVFSNPATSAGTGQTIVIEQHLDAILDDVEARLAALE